MAEIILTADGTAVIENSPVWEKLFAPGWGAGLWQLLTGKLPPEAGDSFFFYRKLARLYAMNLCFRRDRNDETVFSEALVSEEVLKKLLFNRPPLPGGEFLNLKRLDLLQNELAGYARDCWLRAGKPMPGEWMASRDPAWHEVGKLTFHLAENKQDPDGWHPFLFLVTFIHRVAEDGTVRHLPLAGALKLFASDRGQLLALLETLKKCGAVSPLIQQLLSDNRIYRMLPFSAAEAYQLLQALPDIENCGVTVRMVDLWKRRPPKLKLALTLEPAPAAGGGELCGELLVRFKVEAALGGEKLSEKELAELLKSSGGLFRFKEKWVEADGEKVGKLLELWQRAASFSERSGLSFTSGMRLLAGMRPPQPEIPVIDRELCTVTVSPELEKKLLQEALPMPPLPETLARILRPYQLDGVKFLWRVTSLGLGCCLADDMGLGKTLQVLCYLALLKKSGAFRELPALLVLPASLLENWRSEAEKFTPELHFTALHPSALAPGEKERLLRDPAAALHGFDLAATTYQMLGKMEPLQKLRFPAVIVDEAQAIKNSTSTQSRTVRHLFADRRIALTGTPVENRPGDLWSLFDFLNPGLLGSAEEFHADCADMAEKGEWGRLRKLISPVILRRLKSDPKIIRDLPDKSERACYFSLAPEQAVLYAALVEKMKTELTDCDGIARKGVVLKYLTGFKQLCDHPDLYRGGTLFLPSLSGKFARLEELAGQCAARREKLLIFTQFREMTGPLFDLLNRCFGRPGLVLHGGIPVGRRQELVNEFQRPGGPPYFVLSLLAAGTGLNLTAASMVVHFDRWWNPAVENQATDRAYRIGQHRNVQVCKLIASGTIESRIDKMLKRKSALSDALIGETGGMRSLSEWSDEELLELVRLERSETGL